MPRLLKQSALPDAEAFFAAMNHVAEIHAAGLSEIQFEAGMLSKFPAMVWAKRADGVTCYLNEWALNFLGSGEVQNCGDFVHPADRERYASVVAGALAARASFEVEIALRRHDGAYRTVIERGAPMRDRHGAFTGFLGIAEDVTDRRRREDQVAEDVRSRFMQIFEATTDFVGMSTGDGTMTYLNAAARKMIGLALDAPLGWHLSTVHPEWANEIVLQEAVPTALREGFWQGECALLHRDGHEVPVSQVVLSHRGADGEVEFLSTIMRDLSDRKREDVERIEWGNRYVAAIRASGQVLFDWNSFTNEMTYAGDVERLLGYTIAELSGSLECFRSLIHPEDSQIFDDEVKRVTVTRDPFHLKFRLRHKNESYIHIESKGYFFLDRSGQIGRMVGFFADVTEQHNAQVALARVHENLEQRVEERTAELARTYLVIQDRALQQESVAHLGEHALAGAPLPALLDEAIALIRTILHVDFCVVMELSADGEELVATAQTGWPEVHEGYHVSRYDGSQSAFTLLTREPVLIEDLAQETRFQPAECVRKSGAVSSVSVAIEADGKPLGVLIAYTLQRRIFAPGEVHFLKSLTNVISAAIQRERATEAIRTARELAETASRAKSEFLSRMSHELRTPLNAILGFTQLLEVDNPTPEQAESIDHISRAGKHLLSLINEVLDIAKIEVGDLGLVPTDVEVLALLRQTVELVRPLAAQRHVHVTVEAGAKAIHAHADERRLSQVLLNLLTNAVKYNRPDGRVIIRCSEEGGLVRISLQDTGRGIPAAKMEGVFLPFDRPRFEPVETDGAGLAVTRGLVSAMGGELTAESVEGQGSTFFITLPRAEPPAVQAAEAPLGIPKPGTPDYPPQTCTLLYIEDQDLNVRLVERIISSRTPHRLLTAMEGQLGLDLARAHRPQLILLDLHLPDISGDEVLRRLKVDPLTTAIPVLMISADAMGDRVEELLAAGASGYLTKPYKVPEFLRVITETLERS